MKQFLEKLHYFLTQGKARKLNFIVQLADRVFSVMIFIKHSKCVFICVFCAPTHNFTALF